MHPEIFKAYDIRGVVGTSLTPEVVQAIGRALGELAREHQRDTIAVGRDGRLSGPSLAAALIEGIRSSGTGVIDLGMVATPMAYFAAHHLDTACAVMVTGSHNPPEYNGIKMVIDGTTLAGDSIQDLRARVERRAAARRAAIRPAVGSATSATPNVDASAATSVGTGGEAGSLGSLGSFDIAPAYLDRIASDVRLARPLRIAVDCGNGVAGAFAPALYRRLGCEVSELFCDVDGHFPNHHPDPSQPKNLEDLKRHLARGDCELGLAFDGDGDRLGVVTPAGHVIYPDRQLMLFAADVLERVPGATIIYDVKSTRNLKPWIVSHGGVPLLWKTGHSLIKAKMKEVGAALAGEMSGHTFFGERWYGFDDGLYAGARLLEIVSRSAEPATILDALPDAVSTPELNLPCAEGEPQALIARLLGEAQFSGASEVIRIDGLRVEYDDGFGLARASNTTPTIVLRFEADDAAALARIQNDFRHALNAAKPGVVLPF